MGKNSDGEFSSNKKITDLLEPPKKKRKLNPQQEDEELNAALELEQEEDELQPAQNQPFSLFYPATLSVEDQNNQEQEEESQEWNIPLAQPSEHVSWLKKINQPTEVEEPEGKKLQIILQEPLPLNSKEQLHKHNQKQQEFTEKFQHVFKGLLENLKQLKKIESELKPLLKTKIYIDQTLLNQINQYATAKPFTAKEAKNGLTLLQNIVKELQRKDDKGAEKKQQKSDLPLIINLFVSLLTTFFDQLIEKVQNLTDTVTANSSKYIQLNKYYDKFFNTLNELEKEMNFVYQSNINNSDEKIAFLNEMSNELSSTTNEQPPPPSIDYRRSPGY